MYVCNVCVCFSTTNSQVCGSLALASDVECVTVPSLVVPPCICEKCKLLCPYPNHTLKFHSLKMPDSNTKFTCSFAKLCTCYITH